MSVGDHLLASQSISLKQLLSHLAEQGVHIQPWSNGNKLEIQDLSSSNLNNVKFDGLGTLINAHKTQISFLANSKYQDQLLSTQAGAVLVRPDFKDNCPNIALVTQDPYASYAIVSKLFEAVLGDTLAQPAEIHSTAQIHPSVQLGKNVAIGPGVVVDQGSQIGDHVSIGANSVIGCNVSIGVNSKIAPLVHIYARCIIGKSCRIHSHTVIGADGFGYAPAQAGWLRIAQLGWVEIGDHVEIGANSSIDRGAINPTQIKSGVIIDNQVQIAHNVIIGENTAIAGCVGIAGSTQVGKNCTLAGAAGLAGHLTICDNVHIGMQAQVTSSIDAPGQYASGTGLFPLKHWRKVVVHLRRLLKR